MTQPRLIPALVGLALTLGMAAMVTGQEGRGLQPSARAIERGERVYVAPIEGGFDTFFAAAQSQEQKQATSGPSTSTKSCLIVKHKGTVGRRLLWTALIGVPIAPGAKYDHVDAIDFQKAKPTYKGKELQEIQADGVRVIILEKNYKQENLDSARKACREPEVAPTQPKQESKRPLQKQETKPPV